MVATAATAGRRAAARRARLVELLEERATASPHGVAYEFVDGDGVVQRLTYAELRARARSLAAAIVAHQKRREGEARPVVLLYPPGLEYVAAVYACFLARAPAVPAYPPEPWRPDLGLPRLTRILERAGEPSVLADEQVAAGLREVAGVDLGPLLVPDGAGADVDLDVLASATGDDVAIVQYTSGSTTAPRGAAVRHRNLDHNIDAIVRSFDLGLQSRGFIWLPPYHDMGLIGGILTPLVVGFPVRLMSPLDFLKRPLAWLQQVSETQATVSGGPNFAYDLCVRRRAEDEWLHGLDLACWRVAFDGAEPIRWRTLVAFARKFEPAGFDASAFYPCYGLAEATLIVSGRHWDGTVFRGRERVAAPRLEDEQAEPLRVSSGPSLPDQELAIVEPGSGRRIGDGEEGELWIHGPSVVDGYWEGGDEDALFGALDGRRFLRTGDLGYLVSDELVVTGRLKDVIVFRGRNYHAADLEQAAVADAPGLRPAAAAFAVEGEHEPQIVIVVEARPSAGDPDDVAAGVRARVLAATGVPLDAVVVGPPGTIPKTSSGKVQRAVCRERFRANAYEGLVVAEGGAAATGQEAAGEAELEDVLGGVAAGVFAAVCGVETCGRDQTLFEIGGDSLRAAEAAAVLEHAFGLPVPVEVVLGTLTPNELAPALLARWRAAGADLEALRERLAEAAA
jgi:acyl-CoA synthetase (AMP-forming)/AMP-acid ligase II